MPVSLYVYGTLLFPEIQHALLGRILPSQSAILLGYELRTIIYSGEQTDYPVLKPLKNGKIEGQILSGLSTSEFEILNFYEGDAYELKSLPVLIDGKSHLYPCFYPKSNYITEYGDPWDARVFKNEKLHGYLQKIIPDTLYEFNS